MNRRSTPVISWPARSHVPDPVAEQYPAADNQDATVLVDEYDGVWLLRSGADAVPGQAEVARLANSWASTEAQSGVPTVVIGAAEMVPPALWTRLGELLNEVRKSGRQTVRLVVPDHPDRPALAQYIADTWSLGVIASDGTPLITPDGSLFVADPLPLLGGWGLFRPGSEPRPLGRQHPRPTWEAAVTQLPAHTPSGFAIQQIPAGVLITSPASAARPPGDRYYALAADTDRLTIVVGTPGPASASDVPSDDLAALLAALPATARAQVRLVSGTDRELLPTAQEVADTLGLEVELLTALPLVDDATGPNGSPVSRPVLTDATGTVTWAPFVQAVVCRPATDGTEGEPVPRLLHWRPPVPGTGGAGDGVVRLTDAWQVTVTRAGLALGPTGRAMAHSRRAVLADRVAVEVGPPGEPLAASGYRALSRLLRELEPEVRQRVVLYGPGGSADEERRLRRVAIEHGVQMVWPGPDRLDPEPATGSEGLPGAGDGQSDMDGLASHHALVGRIAQATGAARYDAAIELAESLELEIYHDCGEDSPVFLQARKIHAQVVQLAGHQALAAELYRWVADSLLAIRDATDPEVERAAASADACWRAIPAPAAARRIAPSIIALRSRVPGPDGCWLRAAERHLTELDELATTPWYAPRANGSTLGRNW